MQRFPTPPGISLYCINGFEICRVIPDYLLVFLLNYSINMKLHICFTYIYIIKLSNNY